MNSLSGRLSEVSPPPWRFPSPSPSFTSGTPGFLSVFRWSIKLASASALHDYEGGTALEVKELLHLPTSVAIFNYLPRFRTGFPDFHQARAQCSCPCFLLPNPLSNYSFSGLSSMSSSTLQPSPSNQNGSLCCYHVLARTVFVIASATSTRPLDIPSTPHPKYRQNSGQTTPVLHLSSRTMGCAPDGRAGPSHEWLQRNPS